MIVTSGDEVSGYTIVKYISIVQGIVVRTPHTGQGMVDRLKQAVGNIEAQAHVCENARKDAFTRMVNMATQIGADGIIGFRYDTTIITHDHFTEILAYGTAVKLKIN